MNYRETKKAARLGEEGEATNVKPSSYNQRHGQLKGNRQRTQHERATIARLGTKHKQLHYQESQRTAKRREIKRMKSYELFRGETNFCPSGPSVHSVLLSEVEEEEQLSRLVIDESACSQVRDGALLGYFARLAKSSNENDTLDLNFIESLLQQGASVNTSDVYGQAVFHEVARSWSVEAAYFLFQQGYIQLFLKRVVIVNSRYWNGKELWV